MLHAQENTAKIDVENAIPLFLVVVRSRSRLLWLDPSVVEREVQPTESLNGLRHRRLNVLSSGHVATHGDWPSTLFLDQTGSLLVVVLGNVCGHDASPLASECQRRRASDAARSSGHERDFSGEASVSILCHVLLLCMLQLPSVALKFPAFSYKAGALLRGLTRHKISDRRRERAWPQPGGTR